MAVAAIRVAAKKRQEQERTRREQERSRLELASAQAPSPVPAFNHAADVEAPVFDGAAKGSGWCSSQERGFFAFQLQVCAFYESTSTQVFVAVLIVLNFLCNVVEKEIDPHSAYFRLTWRVFEHSFNGIFLVELLINMYARWLRRFWCDSWNIFDFVVVAVGCVSFFTTLEGPFKLLRLLGRPR